MLLLFIFFFLEMPPFPASSCLCSPSQQFSSGSLVSGLGAEQGGSAWPRRGVPLLVRGSLWDLLFFTVSSSRCLGGEKLSPVVAVTVRSIKILVLLNRGGLDCHSGGGEDFPFPHGSGAQREEGRIRP